MRRASSLMLVLALAVSLPVAAIYAQTLLSQLTITNCANTWQFTPVDLSKQTDQLPVAQRNQRTKYFLELLRPELAASALGGGSAVSSSTYLQTYEEIPHDPKSLWLLVTFADYSVIPLEQNGAYTEMHMVVNDVIYNPSGDAIVKGSRLDADVGGGAYIDHNGRKHIFLTTPRRYAMKPGRKYIINASYNTVGGFYSINRHWDVTSGSLVPDTEQDSANVAIGHSHLAGLSTTQAAQHIQNTLAISTN
jgi:hypothetical protein